MFLGKKLYNVSHRIGTKLQTVQKIGHKFGHTLDVGSRKAANTLNRGSQIVGSVSKYAGGTPLEGVATIAQDALRVGRGVAQEARKVGQQIEKKTAEPLANNIMNSFV